MAETGMPLNKIGFAEIILTIGYICSGIGYITMRSENNLTIRGVIRSNLCVTVEFALELCLLILTSSDSCQLLHVAYLKRHLVFLFALFAMCLCMIQTIGTYF